MSRPDRTPFAPIRGRRPVLQNCTCGELQVDPEYQRSLEAGSSQALIRSIAREWDWSLCQPLAIAQRPDGSLWVIDGQHRLAAARLRGDIGDLPCVIVHSADKAEEARRFVGLNARRRPLVALDLFKADLVAGDPDACELAALIAAVGLALAPHTNYASWRPGTIANISGLKRALRDHGRDATRRALSACAQAFAGEVLRYFGTIFPGVAAAIAAPPPALGGGRPRRADRHGPPGPDPGRMVRPDRRPRRLARHAPAPGRPDRRGRSPHRSRPGTAR